MFGICGIWKDGWKVVVVYVLFSGKGYFEDDVWELYYVVED